MKLSKIHNPLLGHTFQGSDSPVCPAADTLDSPDTDTEFPSPQDIVDMLSWSRVSHNFRTPEFPEG